MKPHLAFMLVLFGSSCCMNLLGPADMHKALTAAAT